MVAAELLLLTHDPPVAASLNVVVNPVHKVDSPEIVDMGLTVTEVDAAQPLPEKVYFIVAVPPVTPVTTPTPETVAAAPTTLHVPPDEVSLKTIANPWHTADSPVIAPGVGLTVMVEPLKQPVGSV